MKIIFSFAFAIAIQAQFPKIPASCVLGNNDQCGAQCCNSVPNSSFGVCGPCPAGPPFSPPPPPPPIVNHCPPSIANNPLLCVNGKMNTVACSTKKDCDPSLCCVPSVVGFPTALAGNGWCGPCPTTPPQAPNTPPLVPPPGPAPESACQKDFKNCPNFFKCASDADCPARDWTCAPDVKSCVLRTEFTALQSYIHAGHKDPFNPTATQKRSFLPGNQTEALYKRGSNFWPGGHAESFVLSVFAQYAYQDSVKTLGGGQGAGVHHIL